ncbi:MAG: ABC transporter permease [Coprobacillus cateniformis]|uniref:ABC transporter permease n=1 Tax=Longibaculum muris TaxID=1796628 RepID=UPI003AB3306E|nr:ABC transporter permease [Coprobacillus cateniformis]
MKNNLLHHFAIQDLKTHHKDTKVTLLTLIILTFVIMMITFLTPFLLNSYILNSQAKHGYYDYKSYTTYDKDEILKTPITYQNKETMFKDADFQYALVADIGYSSGDDSIHYIEGNKDILSIQLKDGYFPQKENEVAIKESTLKRLGYDIKLNQNIEVAYQYYQSKSDGNDEWYNAVGQWKVVGILQESGDTDILLGKQTTPQKYAVYIDTYKQENISVHGDIRLDRVFDLNQDIGPESQLDFLIVVVEFVLFIVGCIIVSGLTIASFENRKNDYTLLRGIGATKRQVYYIVFIQAMILALLSIIVASIAYVIVGNIFILIVDTIIPLQFSWNYYLGCVFIIVLMSLISYFMPARGATRRALSGSFESAEFQYFYYRYKKRHQMRPMYLGWRQLVNNKKQMIFKIFFVFIASLMTMSIIGDYIYSIHLTKQRNEYVETSQNVTLKYSPIIDNTNIHPDDFKTMSSYAKDILYTHNFLYSPENGYGHKIYCFDENVKKQFLLPQDQVLKTGEMIVSEGFNRESNMQIYSLADGNVFQIVNILSDYEDSFMIMAKDDFIKYADVKHYQEVYLSFESIAQKNQAILAFAKDNPKMKYNVIDSSLQQQRDEEYQRSKELVFDFPTLRLALIIATSVIYIYQLSFELLKQRETIATYQLLGLRKIEIWKIYMYKSLFIASLGFVFALYYHFADMFIAHGGNGGWHIFMDPIPFLQQVIPTLILIVILISFSLLPIYSILKKDGLENKTIRE